MVCSYAYPRLVGRGFVLNGSTGVEVPVENLREMGQVWVNSSVAKKFSKIGDFNRF
jgi:hypothetical protein